MELKDKVVLITGSSSGIGRVAAIRFAKEGSKVVINYRENKRGAEETLKEIRSIGGEAIVVQADVSKEADIIKLFKDTVASYGTLDILINNAGIPTDKVDFLKAPQADINEIFNTNITGAMLCSQKAIEIMQAQGNGKIINTTSIRGWEHGGRAPVYAASKAALNSFTRTLAKIVAPNILVNAVAPGFVRTRNYDNLPVQMHKQFLDQTVLKKWITEDDISDAFIYLAKSDALTGQVIYVDGGFTLK